jgi:hypothetical protein
VRFLGGGAEHDAGQEAEAGDERFHGNVFHRAFPPRCLVRRVGPMGRGALSPLILI